MFSGSLRCCRVATATPRHCCVGAATVIWRTGPVCSAQWNAAPRRAKVEARGGVRKLVFAGAEPRRDGGRRDRRGYRHHEAPPRGGSAALRGGEGGGAPIA